ncbi:MAG: hypothetical protein KME26_05645 [Oscillatoria princeps RMCB-10]|nr:hypothetical protein [Oscillatoria princeps RMCB-10]
MSDALKGFYHFQFSVCVLGKGEFWQFCNICRHPPVVKPLLAIIREARYAGGAIGSGLSAISVLIEL